MILTIFRWLWSNLWLEGSILYIEDAIPEPSSSKPLPPRACKRRLRAAPVRPLRKVPLMSPAVFPPDVSIMMWPHGHVFHTQLRWTCFDLNQASLVVSNLGGAWIASFCTKLDSNRRRVWLFVPLPEFFSVLWSRLDAAQQWQCLWAMLFVGFRGD